LAVYPNTCAAKWLRILRMTMKSSPLAPTKSFPLVVGLGLGLLLQSQLSVWAQPNPDRPARPERPGAERPVRALDGPAAGANFERFLTEEQRQSLRETMLAQRAKSQELLGQVRVQRQELLKAVLTEDVTDEALRAKVEAVAKLEAELQFLRLKALAEVQPPLAPEQVDRMLNAAAESPQRQLRQLPDENRAAPRLNRPLPPRGEEVAPRPPRRDLP
jgi:Spy/CpxP family protein refolding chaperone